MCIVYQHVRCECRLVFWIRQSAAYEQVMSEPRRVELCVRVVCSASHLYAIPSRYISRKMALTSNCAVKCSTPSCMCVTLVQDNHIIFCSICILCVHIYRLNALPLICNAIPLPVCMPRQLLCLLRLRSPSKRRSFTFTACAY